jgi:formamidopyrimidine-DNA glycosylase
MPELPDVELYRSHLERRFVGKALTGLRFASPFVLRTYEPKAESFVGKKVVGVRRLGKRIVFAVEGERFVVVHLMISGRLKLREANAKIPGKLGLCAFDFADATVLLTEASTHKRASVHLLQGEDALAAMDPGGLEPLEIDLAAFRARLLDGNHTLKRALTDPRHFSGIGNAYSDELLHRAKLSPVKLVSRLTEDEIARLYEATRGVLIEWTRVLADEVGDAFPETVTAFRPDMAVHGKYGVPCPVCETPVQRIRYANNEANYCPTCQTEGKLLADRALSRLLGKEWPKSLEELELHKAARKVDSPPSPPPPTAPVSPASPSAKPKRAERSAASAAMSAAPPKAPRAEKPSPRVAKPDAAEPSSTRKSKR